MIQRLSPAIRQYVRAFNIVALAQWRDGRHAVIRPACQKSGKYNKLFASLGMD